MNGTFLRDHKALGLGAIAITVFGIVHFSIGTFFFVPTPLWIIINVLSFLLVWLLVSFLIHKFSTIVLGLLGLLLVASLADYHLKVFNPISIPANLLFLLGLTYLIVPQFFKKYQIAILIVYGAAITYFFVFRLAPNFSEDHIQNLFNLVLLPIPIFAVLWGYEHWRWLKTLESDKAKAELSLLKSQINPHFFFNTLNNLYGLSVEKSDKAPEVILKLSDMMRYTIYEGKEDLVLLKDEITYLENYIELHKIRYQKEVDIVFTHDAKEGLRIAPLLFIILLENAFKHGVDRMPNKAFIHMDMRYLNKELRFTIANSFDNTASDGNKGIGLENLEKRLSYLYPRRHTLTIEEKESEFIAYLNIELV